MKVKEESEKVGLKLNIQKTKIMASGPITSWEIDGETVETVSDFMFWGSKITADTVSFHLPTPRPGRCCYYSLFTNEAKAQRFSLSDLPQVTQQEEQSQHSFLTQIPCS